MTQAVTPRMGRIQYLNSLPVYHGMECGAVSHGYELVYGPPARLNDMMAAGALAASPVSCIEYARRPERYLLLSDLSISSDGAVGSVALLSRRPLQDMAGHGILLSAESHTSVNLLRLLLARRYKIAVSWETGAASEQLARGALPEAMLVIGDEALRLRRHPAYPHQLDLGEAWKEWTGLPFVYAVWIASRIGAGRAADPGACLRASRDWGAAHMDRVVTEAQRRSPMARQELEAYFQCLYYRLGARELDALRLFYTELAAAGLISAVPELRFF